MALTVTQATAAHHVIVALLDTGAPIDVHVADAMTTLAHHAHKTLGVGLTPDDIRARLGAGA